MRLEITKAFNKEFTEDCYKIATSMLEMKSTHLMIASNKWDSIYLELLDSIPEGFLEHLHTVCATDIKVKLPETFTEKTLQLLTELYPDRAGKLRKAYLFNRSVEGVLADCLVD